MDIFKTKSKNFWIVLLMSNVFVSLSLYAQKPYMEESFAVGNNVRIEVLTSGGSIEVKGSERDNVHVEMIVKQRGKAIEAGEADLDNWDISIDKRVIQCMPRLKREIGLIGVEIILAYPLLCMPLLTQKQMLKPPGVELF